MNHAAIFSKIANFDRRITDEERNQKESSTEEEGRREEKEVAAVVQPINVKAPATGPFLFAALFSQVREGSRRMHPRDARNCHRA
jgi:hypothetical protein